jgi:DhnA family fructose-bisphosphate aldolase class Ia
MQGIAYHFKFVAHACGTGLVVSGGRTKDAAVRKARTLFASGGADAAAGRPR